MRRKTVLTGSPNYVAPAYSWAATLSLAFVATVLSSDEFLGPIWALLGLTLFEIGRFTRKGFLRWQGYFLAAVAFLRFLVFELFAPGHLAPITVSANGLLESYPFSLIYSLLLEVLILATVGYLLFERTRTRCTRREHFVGLAADALGTLSIALWFAYRFPSDWVPVPGGETWVTAIWAAMATALLALAWFLRRKTFLVQAILLAIAVLARGVFFDLFADSPDSFWRGPLFHLAVASLILIAALPFAFLLRNHDRFGESSITLPADLATVVRHPEQVFFFSAFALEVLALAFKLSSGRITIAWSSSASASSSSHSLSANAASASPASACSSSAPPKSSSWTFGSSRPPTATSPSSSSDSRCSLSPSSTLALQQSSASCSNSLQLRTH